MNGFIKKQKKPSKINENAVKDKRLLSFKWLRYRPRKLQDVDWSPIDSDIFFVLVLS